MTTQAKQYIKAHNFFAHIYRAMAVAVPGEEEWLKIGKEENWTPEQIAIAEVIAVQTRQELYALARQYERP